VSVFAPSVGERLVELVEIFSPSGEETEIVEHLAGLLEQEGLEPRRIATPGGVDNLVVGAVEPHLVLTAHVDTIRPSWQWGGRAEVRDGAVFGLGAVDNKAGVVAALEALRIAAAGGVDIASVGTAIAFTVDEEVGGTGSLAVAESLRPTYTIALEATGLAPGVAEAGVVTGVAELWGRSVHGSLPEYGDNAIVKAAALILALEEADFTTVEHELLGAALPCVERIAGGSSLYVVPDRAEFGFDIRVVPGVTAAEVLTAVGELCARFDASLSIDEAVDAFEVSTESRLVKALADATRRVTGSIRPHVGVPAWTDAHNFTAAGSEAVVFGPGRLLGSAHQPDEHVAIEDVVTAGRILGELILKEAEALA